MHLLAILYGWLLGIFRRLDAGCKAVALVRRDERRAPRSSEPPSGRDAGFGWMNVASVLDERPAPPGWDGGGQQQRRRLPRWGG